MKMDLKRPCADCPFRNDGAGIRLRHERAEEIAESLMDGKTFACHKTTHLGEWDEDPETGEEVHRHSGQEQHCAGALILLQNEGMLLKGQWNQVASRLGWFDPDGLDLSAPAFDSFESFILNNDEL